MQRYQTLVALAIFVIAAGCESHAVSSLTTNGPSVIPYTLQGGGQPLNWTRFAPNTYSSQYGGVIAGPGGAMWFTDLAGNGLVRMAMDGSSTEFPLPTGFHDNGANAIAKTPDGKLYILACRGDLELVSARGKVLFDILPPGTGFCVVGGGSGIFNGLAVDANGDAWIPYAEGVTKVTETGASTEYLYPNGLNNGQGSGITAGPVGDMWFVQNADAGSYIGAVDPTTGAITEFSLPFGCDLSKQGIVAPADGNLWFGCDTSSYGKITPTGSATLFRTPGSVQLYDTPLQATVGPGGFPWFIAQDGVTKGVAAINTNTGALTYHPAHYTDQPQSIALGPDGNLWMPTDGGHVEVYIKYVLTVSPTSLNFPSTQTTATITAKETGKPTLSASSSNTGIASVTPGQQQNTFVVEALAIGTCTITVQDSRGNLFQVPVVVQ